MSTKGKKVIGIQFDDADVMALKKKAESIGFSTGAYIRVVMVEWLKSGKKLKLQG